MPKTPNCIIIGIVIGFLTAAGFDSTLASEKVQNISSVRSTENNITVGDKEHYLDRNNLYSQEHIIIASKLDVTGIIQYAIEEMARQNLHKDRQQQFTDEQEALFVKKLQEDLIWTGHYNGIIDGDFGSGTKRAVKSFQKGIRNRPTGRLSQIQRISLKKKADSIKDSIGWKQITTSDIDFGFPSSYFNIESVTINENTNLNLKTDSVRLLFHSNIIKDNIFSVYTSEINSRNITYKYNNEYMYVITGFENDNYFYKKYITSNNNNYSFELRWPKEKKRLFDRIAVAMSNYFRPHFTNGPQLKVTQPSQSTPQPKGLTETDETIVGLHPSISPSPNSNKAPNPSETAVDDVQISSQVDQINLRGSIYKNDKWTLSVSGPISSTVVYTVKPSDTSGDNAFNVATNWTAAINADPIIGSFLTAEHTSVFGDKTALIRLTAKKPGAAFSSAVSVFDASQRDRSANNPLVVGVSTITQPSRSTLQPSPPESSPPEPNESVSANNCPNKYKPIGPRLFAEFNVGDSPDIVLCKIRKLNGYENMRYSVRIHNSIQATRLGYSKYRSALDIISYQRHINLLWSNVNSKYANSNRITQHNMRAQMKALVARDVVRLGDLGDFGEHDNVFLSQDIGPTIVVGPVILSDVPFWLYLNFYSGSKFLPIAYHRLKMGEKLPMHPWKGKQVGEVSVLQKALLISAKTKGTKDIMVRKYKIPQLIQQYRENYSSENIREKIPYELFLKTGVSSYQMGIKTKEKSIRIKSVNKAKYGIEIRYLPIKWFYDNNILTVFESAKKRKYETITKTNSGKL